LALLQTLHIHMHMYVTAIDSDSRTAVVEDPGRICPPPELK